MRSFEYCARNEPRKKWPEINLRRIEVDAPRNKPMEPTALTLAVRHVLVASWARRRPAVAVLRPGRGSSASRWVVAERSAVHA
jgi:hypothetical protein